MVKAIYSSEGEEDADVKSCIVFQSASHYVAGFG
jgi:hypothetical protein